MRTAPSQMALLHGSTTVAKRYFLNAAILILFTDIILQPYVYNPKTDVMVSYDNAKSFEAKGNFIKQNQLRGFSLWEAGGDFNDILLDSIREAAGFDDCD